MKNNSKTSHHLVGQKLTIDSQLFKQWIMKTLKAKETNSLTCYFLEIEIHANVHANQRMHINE